MDWKSNPWVGVGAAILLVVGVAVVYLWTTGESGPSTSLDEAVYRWFQCESTGEVFAVTYADVTNNEDDYLNYMSRAGEAVPCKICGEEDAYMVYWDPGAGEWVRMTPADERAEQYITTPSGVTIDVGQLSWTPEDYEKQGQKKGAAAGGGLQGTGE
ncbi:MAG: hypothetical protein J7M14_06070 [Planctomycetes bacterium]|nr:hypothetical protein [Planctomycetota bacterium]